MIGPYFEELAGKFPGVVFVKVDVDDLDDVAAECGISAMPTFQLYSNGVKVEELTGADKGKLEALAKSCKGVTWDQVAAMKKRVSETFVEESKQSLVEQRLAALEKAFG